MSTSVLHSRDERDQAEALLRFQCRPGQARNCAPRTPGPINSGRCMRRICNSSSRLNILLWLWVPAQGRDDSGDCRAFCLPIVSPVHVSNSRCASTFPRRVTPEFSGKRAPQTRRGRRECRVKASPMARLQQRKQAAVTTGSAGSSGIPCAMGLRLIRTLPRDRLSCPCRPRARQSAADLTSAPGGQDHAISPSASPPFVSRRDAAIASPPRVS